METLVLHDGDVAVVSRPVGWTDQRGNGGLSSSGDFGDLRWIAK